MSTIEAITNDAEAAFRRASVALTFAVSLGPAAMSDPVTAQTLFDAFQASITSPGAQTLYGVAKDFQTIAAALLVLFAARLAYRGVLKRIEFEGKIAQTERREALLERQNRRCGALLRLQSQMRRLEVDASLILQRLAVPLAEAEGKVDQIAWTDGLAFGDYDELERAWRTLGLFPPAAIFNIDAVRTSLARTKEKEARCLADRNETGSIRLVNAKLFRDGCVDVERQAKFLVGNLEGPIRELAKKQRLEERKDHQ
jgi:hypothetical protein